MSFADYNKQMQLNNAIFSKYQSVLMDTGISSPQGYNVLSDPQVTTLKSAQMAGTAPLYLNPAGELYTHGAQNQVLTASSSSQCSPGCLANAKPDPRVKSIKPLYSAFVFSGKPASYAGGMY